MRDRIDFTPDYGTKQNTSIIKVIGVGGGGSNAVKHMYSEGIVGVDFLICTDTRLSDLRETHSERTYGIRMRRLERRMHVPGPVRFRPG